MNYFASLYSFKILKFLIFGNPRLTQQFDCNSDYLVHLAGKIKSISYNLQLENKFNQNGNELS